MTLSAYDALPHRDENCGRTCLVATLPVLLAVLLGPKVSRADSAHDWGVEAELVQPFIPGVRILSMRGTRTAWGEATALRGDVMVGVFARPGIAHDVVETLNEYLATGTRQ